MIFMLLGILSSASVSLLMRLSSFKIKNNISMLTACYVTCTLVAAFYTGTTDLFPAHPGLGRSMALGTVNGILYLAGFVLYEWSIRTNGVVLSAVFMKLGLLVPMVVSVVLFRDMPDTLQTIGFFVAIGGIILINWQKGGGSFGMGLILLLLTGGSADAMSKVYEQLGHPDLGSHFLFYTFLVSLILCTALMIYKKERPGKYEVLFGFLIGVPNYFASRFVLRALASVPAVIVYPTCSVSTILVVTLAGVLLFKERLQKRQWLALAVILVAIVLLNI